MKKTLKFIAFSAILLMLAGSFFSCKDTEEYDIYSLHNISACGVNDPLQNIEWLREIVGELKKDAEAGYKQHARIYQCHYKDGIGFLLELCVDCPDYGYWLRGCDGESLCVLWGYAGDSCSDFDVDFENKTLILEINN